MMTSSETSRITGECHPACMLLPEMGADEYRELVEDIRNFGQRRPIVIDESGRILDGRHRWRACRELFVSPKAETFTGTEEQKVALVMSENIHRRHLTTAQRAAIAAELATMKRGTRTDLPSFDGKSAGLSNAQAAKVMGVSEPTVERAKRRMREDPDAHAQAKAGTLPRKPPTPPVERLNLRKVPDRPEGLITIYPAQLAPETAATEVNFAEIVRDLVRDWSDAQIEACMDQATGPQKASLTKMLPKLQEKLAKLTPPQPRSRAGAWATAVSDAQNSLETLIELQSEFEDWRDGLPEFAQDGATAEKLDAVCNLDLQGALDAVNEAADVELPMGFGRD